MFCPQVLSFTFLSFLPKVPTSLYLFKSDWRVKQQDIASIEVVREAGEQLGKAEI